MNTVDLFFTILAGKVSQQLTRVLGRRFKLHGVDITPEQFVVMSTLWKQDGIAQQLVCEQTGKEKTSITRLIDNLEKQNTVVRITDSADRRNKLLYLTKKGRELETLTNQVVLHTIQEALDGIPAQDLEVSRQTMIKVLNNLER